MGQMKKLSDLLTLDELEFWLLEQMKDQQVMDVGVPCDCYNCPLANYLEAMGYCASIHAEEIHIFPTEGGPVDSSIRYTSIPMPSELSYFIGYCDRHHSYITPDEAYTALEDARREISRVTSNSPM